MTTPLRSYLPEFLKPLLRLVRYKNERKKFIREIGIRKKQNEALNKNYNPSETKLIVFLVVGSDWATGDDFISGGTISIVSICEETAALQNIHHAATIMCTFNNDHLLLKHRKFENNTAVYRFSQLKDYFSNLDSLIIHMPELLAAYFADRLSKGDKEWLKKIPSFQLNIMNQNIRLMPEPAALKKLNGLTQQITITTAHTKYCNQYYRNYFGVPLHKLSVWISPEQYQFTQWREKENLLVVSPDPHPVKEAILQNLSEEKGLTVQIIQNLTYTEYKKLVSRAKWTLTFGEGLDGYFIEPVFSGAIAFGVFNNEFFTDDFSALPTLYSSFQELNDKIRGKIKELDNEADFKKYQHEQFEMCALYYSKEQYKKNIVAFYKGEYTYA